MKIQAPLFSNPPVAPRAPTQASEARLAFEAMLSAGAARQTIAMPARVDVEPPQPSPNNEPNPPTGEAPVARPGRVLDIKV
jgi:hypothetical protein